MFCSKRFYFFVLIVALTVSCAPKKPTLYYDESFVIKEIEKKNPQKCDYKGRVYVIYKDEQEDIRFRGLLDKKCSEEFELKILGAFSSVVYHIIYSYGDVKAYEKGLESSEKIKLFMQNRGLDTFVLGLKYPYLLPDESYNMSVSDFGYVFRKPFSSIETGTDFQIQRLRSGNVFYEYEYDKDRMTVIKLRKGKTNIEIGLQN